MNLFQAAAELEKRTELKALLIGGHAVNAYGYSRTKLDIDFLILESDLPLWRRELERLGYLWRG